MSNPQVPRLKDVAELAEVSLAAASRILRGDRQSFGEDTCKRVLEAAQKLGWRRNLLVSGVQTGRTRTVGVMIPPLGSYWVGVLSGIHEALAAADYLPITVWTPNLCGMPNFENHEREGHDQIDRLLDRRVDGLIMWPPFSIAYYHHYPEFAERRVPVTVIDHYSTVADSVETDEEQATKIIVDHLVRLGHRRMACLSRRETPSQTWAVKRRSSFEQAVARCEGGSVQSWHLNPHGSDGLDVARQILQSDLNPTAVFAVSDNEADCIYKAAAEMGLRIPADLSVVGFADLDFAATMDPPLTTMRQQPEEIGRLAARLLLDRVDGNIADDAPVTRKVSAELIVRQSTGPASR
jgi:LacI family transcriptional regulator